MMDLDLDSIVTRCTASENIIQIHQKGNIELACFGNTLFTWDIEGIAIIKNPNQKRFIIVSDQQVGTFQVFTIESNEYVKP